MAAGGIARLQANSGGWEKEQGCKLSQGGSSEEFWGEGLRGKWSEAAGHASLGFISSFTLVIFLTISKDVYFVIVFLF